MEPMKQAQRNNSTFVHSRKSFSRAGWGYRLIGLFCDTPGIQIQSERILAEASKNLADLLAGFGPQVGFRAACDRNCHSQAASVSSRHHRKAILSAPAIRAAFKNRCRGNWFVVSVCSA